jgi:hypothetical protein
LQMLRDSRALRADRGRVSVVSSRIRTKPMFTPHLVAFRYPPLGISHTLRWVSRKTCAKSLDGACALFWGTDLENACDRSR